MCLDDQIAALTSRMIQQQEQLDSMKVELSNLRRDRVDHRLSIIPLLRHKVLVLNSFANNRVQSIR